MKKGRSERSWPTESRGASAGKGEPEGAASVGGEIKNIWFLVNETLMVF